MEFSCSPLFFKVKKQTILQIILKENDFLQMERRAFYSY